VKGDREAAYHTVNRKRLKEILSEKITDKKFMNLINDRLNYEYVENVDGKTIRSRPTVGIPQGGIDSPYLFNIYMHKFNEFIKEDISYMLNGLNVKCGECGARTKESVKLRNLIRGEKRKMRWIKEKVHKETDLETIDKLRKEFYTHIKTIKKIGHHARKSVSTVPNKRAFRVFSTSDMLMTGSY
jgi:hypothetical protein